MSKTTDWAIFIKQNENVAMKQLYDTLKEPFTRWVLSKDNIDVIEADDIFQNSMCILYQNVMLNKVKTLQNPKSYLYTVGKNKILELYRNKKKYMTESLDNPNYLQVLTEEPYHEDSKEEQYKELREAIEVLGDPGKSIIYDFYFHKESLQVISQNLGYKNATTAKTKKFKTMKRLKNILEKNRKEKNYN